MVSATLPRPPLGNQLFDFPAERMIALARLVLIAFALAAIYADPTQPSGNVVATYTITGLYAAVAALELVLALRRSPTRRGHLLVHGVDVAFVSILIYMTEGPTSPFFVFFTFILLAGTLRWNWRGALGTSALLVVVFLALLAAFSDQALADRDELNRAIIRAGYLLVAGAMLGYVGAYRERSARRLAQLVAWPGPQPTAVHQQDDLAPPPIAPALAHAALLMRASRVLVVWEAAEEPSRHVALWTTGDGLRHSRERADRFGTLVAPIRAEATFLIGDADPPPAGSAGSNVQQGSGGIAAVPPSSVDPDLRRIYGIRDALTAPFRLPLCKGRVFLLDRCASGDDDLLLTELIAVRLGVDLEHHLMRARIETTATLTERVRLARDLHDGVLQSLTAASIHLKLCSRQAGGNLADQLTQIRQTLTEEQRRVRGFVEDHRSAAASAPDATSAGVDLAGTMEERLRQLEREWGCRVEFTTSPLGLRAPPHLARHISYLLTEAVSNAIRHGGASRIAVSVMRSPEGLRLRIADNGRGFTGLEGSYGDDALSALRVGPRSLRARAKDLGGTVSLRTGPSGSDLEIKLPA